MRMFKARSTALTAPVLLALSACGVPSSTGDGGTPSPTPTMTPTPVACPIGTTEGAAIATPSGGSLRVCILSGRINADLTLRNITGVVYQISGRVEVGSDVGGDGASQGGTRVVLTMEPGVVAFGRDTANAYLIINRGSKISAVGTPSQPIIFTSYENITTNINDAAAQSWGGIFVLGRAPISDCDTAVPGGSTACQHQVPGFTSYPSYGGSTVDDSSGILRYVQIRFAGRQGNGGEGAGLMLAGVGSGTTIDHVQVAFSASRGVAAYGGRVNLSYLALHAYGGIGLYADQGYRGTVQFVVGAQAPNGLFSELIAIDDTFGDNEDALPRTYVRVSNATLVERSVHASANGLLTAGGADSVVLNTVVSGVGTCLDIDEAGQATTRAANSALEDIGPPVFRSTVLACPKPFRGDDGSVSAATIATLFGSGANNNNSAFTSTLTDDFADGSNESGVVATNPTPFNADPSGPADEAAANRLVSTTLIGAIQGNGDNSFQAWTCNSNFANYGPGAACAAPPR